MRTRPTAVILFASRAGYHCDRHNRLSSGARVGAGRAPISRLVPARSKIVPAAWAKPREAWQRTGRCPTSRDADRGQFVRRRNSTRTVTLAKSGALDRSRRESYRAGDRQPNLFAGIEAPGDVRDPFRRPPERSCQIRLGSEIALGAGCRNIPERSKFRLRPAPTDRSLPPHCRQG